MKMMEFYKNATIPVPLKYLSYFWRSLEMSLINCKVELKLNGQSNATSNDNFHYQRHKVICPYCNFIGNRQLKSIKTS